MIGTTYKCYGCSKTSTLLFADSYKPFVRWMLTCLKCGKYHIHRLTFADSYPMARGVHIETRGDT